MEEMLPIDTTEITSDERTLATLAHILQLVAWWIAPLIILLAKRDSRFVSFHALQALLLQILYAIVMGVFMVAWFGTFFLSMANHGGSNNTGPPPGFFVLFPLLWLGFMGLWVLMLVIAIMYGRQGGAWRMGAISAAREARQEDFKRLGQLAP